MAITEVYQISIVDGLIEQQLDPNHELLVLSRKLDWDAIEEGLKTFYSRLGRRAKSIRLMVGLLILKHRFNVSDEQVVKGIHENLYWRAFCGIKTQLGVSAHCNELDASSLTKFRRRIGPQGVHLIETCIRAQLRQDRLLDEKAIYVDTTVQEKRIAYPVDTFLLQKAYQKQYRALKKLQKLGLKISVKNRLRSVKRTVLLTVKLGQGRQERIETANTKLGEINEEMQSFVKQALKAKNPNLPVSKQRQIQRLKDELRKLSELAERVVTQSKSRFEGIHVKQKVLSLHEPEVVAIQKGKRSRHTEFGSKVALATDNNLFVISHHEYTSNLFVISHHEYTSNVFDPQTLEPAVEDWKECFGKAPVELAADRGFHDDDLPEIISELPYVSIPRKGNIKHPDHKTARFRRLQRKRASQEPIISHLKSDHRMDRCRYKGFAGDQMNVGLAVIAWNTKRWVRLTQERQKA